MSDVAPPGAPVPQQDFLRAAMATLAMDRLTFAQRFGVTKRALDNWLLPDGSKQGRPMPGMAWKYIGEVLTRHARCAPGA
ncbi:MULTISPECIES: transcriptional regulator [Cupriavidus]